MKTTSTPKTKQRVSQAMESEYRFDYSKAKPNRFAGRMREGSLAVLLDPDVARVFRDAKSVNAVLRALMAAIPALRAGEAPK